MANTEKRGNNPYYDLMKNAKGQSIESLMSKLSPSDRQKVQSILSDPEEKNKFLSSPAVQELIRKFKGNG